MDLRAKYDSAIQACKGKMQGNAEQRGDKLYFTGTVTSDADLNAIWNAIKTVPDWRNDVVADIKVVPGAAPAASAARTYTVQAGDTLSKIAKETLGNAAQLHGDLQRQPRSALGPGQDQAGPGAENPMMVNVGMG